MLQQQWPWLTPSGHPPSMSTASSHLFISYTLLLYLTSKIVSPCRCALVVYQFVFCFRRNEKCVEKNSGNPEMSSYLPFKHWPRYCIFSYSRNQVGYYILSWCNGDYDHIFTRCTRCPPACLCVHELSVDSWRRMWLWWQLYRECLCYCCNIECLFSFFSFFLSMRDSCVCACVLAFEHWSSPVREVNRCKSDSLHLRERLCVCVHIFACLTGCCDS